MTIQLNLVSYLNPDHGPSWCLETKAELVWEEREHELPNKGPRLIHPLLDLCCKVNINPNSNLEQWFRN